MKIRKNGSHKFIIVLAMSILISWAAAAKTSEKWDAKATAWVNLRRNPGLNGIILSIVPKGRKVRIIEKKGLWRKVDVEGETHGKGWVYAKYLEETLPKSLATESAEYLEETLPTALATESTSYLEETLPTALATESASYLEEILPKALETGSALETVGVENTSGGQTQVIHPAESPPKARPADNKENSLNTAPPAKASRVRDMEKLSIRDDFRSAKDKSIADSKRDVPIAGEAIHVAPTLGPSDARTENEKAKPANTSSPLKNSTAGATEQPSVRDELGQANHESNAQSPVDLLLTGKPLHMPPAEPPYTDFNQETFGIVTESSLGVIERRSADIHHQSLPAGEMKHGAAIQETPIVVREKAVTDVPAVAAPKRKETLFRSELMRPAKLVLKLLSIVLSGLVLLLLYMENKTATQRYIEQTEHAPAKHGALD